ncbi:hypothetical protein M3Y97_00945900 [Aphelenchoides bicaudatus]|nr:hypothetical protein M3Y97_00945900 [Aphelenchoides bicaudatus]
MLISLVLLPNVSVKFTIGWRLKSFLIGFVIINFTILCIILVLLGYRRPFLKTFSTKFFKQHLHFKRPDITSHIPCHKFYNPEYDPVYLASKFQVTYNEAKDLQDLPMDCSSILARNNFHMNPMSKEEEEFPIAIARNVFKDYLFQEVVLSTTYAPQNYYCYSIDGNANSLFRKRMNSLTKCFPNVHVTDFKAKMDSFGHNTNAHHIECLKWLATKDKNWKYVSLLQNHDVPLKTNQELVQILKWMNGTNDVTTQIRRMWVDKASRNKLTVNGNAPILPITRGLVQVTMSRKSIDFIFDTLDLQRTVDQFNSKPGTMSDEALFSSINSNDNIQLPGGFTQKCAPTAGTVIGMTRFNVWSANELECNSNAWRHDLCILGLADLRFNFVENEYLFANKMLPEHDFGAVVCWSEMLFNRTHFDRGIHRLNKTLYVKLPQVRYNKAKRKYRDKFDVNHPGEQGLPMDCDSILARNNFYNVSMSKEEADFPIAYARNVFRDYRFLEIILSTTYAPQNFYCYSIDGSAKPLFRKRLHQLAKCFPNILITDFGMYMDSNGHNTNYHHMACLKMLSDKSKKWKYVMMLQNHDVSLKTNQEMVQIFKWMNGTNDVTTQERNQWKHLPWDFQSLRLFKDPARNNLTVDGNKPVLDLSRIRTMEQLNSFPTTTVDEFLISSLNSNDNIRLPGGFTQKCYRQIGTVIGLTRFGVWIRRKPHCGSQIWRHDACIFGLEDLLSKFVNNPFFNINKMYPDNEFGAIVCWNEALFNRTHNDRGIHRLNKNSYAKLPQVRLNNARKEYGSAFNMSLFNCGKYANDYIGTNILASGIEVNYNNPFDTIFVTKTHEPIKLLHFIRPNVTKDLPCYKFFDPEFERFYLAKKHRIKYRDPEEPQDLPTDCASISARNHFDRIPLSMDELKFPIAFARNVYRDYHFLEMMLAINYAPQNIYCYSIDGKADPLFRKRMEDLAKCFPNVHITDFKANMDSKGHNTNAHHLECLKWLLTKNRHWKYVMMLQNHDIPLKTNQEMVQILKWYKGTNDVTAQYSKRMAEEEKEDVKWSFRKLHLFKDFKRNKLTVNGHAPRLTISHGTVQSIMSRKAVDFIVEKLNLESTIKLINKKWATMADDILFTSLNNNDNIQLPGGFTQKLDLWSRNETQCDSGIWRNELCVFGLEDVRTNFVQNNFFFANKMMPKYDFGAIVCWSEKLFDRTHYDRGIHRLNKTAYEILPQIRYNNAKRKYGTKFDINRFNCTKYIGKVVPLYSEMDSDEIALEETYSSY